MRLPRECRDCTRTFDAYTGERPKVRCGCKVASRASEAPSEPVYFQRLRDEIRAGD